MGSSRKLKGVKVLSFDVSSVSTGWAYFVGGNLKNYSIIAIDKKHDVVKKLTIFSSDVRYILQDCQADYIVIEETYLRNVKTLKTLMMFIGVLAELVYRELDVIPFFIYPATVRSYFSVKNKEEAFEFVKAKYKLKLKFKDDNDITDAILQGLYYLNVIKENIDGK